MKVGRRFLFALLLTLVLAAPAALGARPAAADDGTVDGRCHAGWFCGG